MYSCLRWAYMLQYSHVQHMCTAGNQHISTGRYQHSTAEDQDISIAQQEMRTSAGCRRYLAQLHDDMHHVALLIAFIVLDNVGVVQAV